MAIYLMMTLHTPNRMARITLWLLWLLAAVLAFEAVVSLRWRIYHDSPILYYVAMLIGEHNFVPYEDIFETSFPGTLFVYYVIANWFGYSDISFRLIDLTLLATIMYLVYRLMQTFGSLPSMVAPVLFGLAYLGGGPTMSMQREYIALLPILFSFVLATSFGAASRFSKLLVIGACFGFAASIKPHLALGILPLLFYISCMELPENATPADRISRFFMNGVIAFIGFLPVMAVPFIWVWLRGGLPAFVDMLTEYMPLYLQMTGDREKLSFTRRMVYLVKTWRMSYAGFWVAAVLGAWIALEFFRTNRQQRALLFLLIAELLVFSFMPVAAGQFWPYHWLPFFLFASLCAAFLLMPVFTAGELLERRVASLVIFVFFLSMTLQLMAGDMARSILGKPLPPVKEGRVDATAEFLSRHLQPGDTVQSFDSVGGTIHALLLARAKLASPYICDFYFYHDVSNPVIQDMRARFVEKLESSRPRFIIDSVAKVKPKGRDASTQFPGLEQYMAASYHVVYDQNGVTIFERNTSSRPELKK